MKRDILGPKSLVRGKSNPVYYTQSSQSISLQLILLHRNTITTFYHSELFLCHSELFF